MVGEARERQVILLLTAVASYENPPQPHYRLWWGKATRTTAREQEHETKEGKILPHGWLGKDICNPVVKQRRDYLVAYCHYDDGKPATQLQGGRKGEHAPAERGETPDSEKQLYNKDDHENIKLNFTESYRLEKTFKIIEANRKPNTTKTTTIPCP
ncbi:hypothetical protein QYF61_000094 [Mycteria americana]|uniref:Uncharacterized protein n=1 Tax=Mycteria americana TaxID=33587 RepID=A0AAN7RWJ4_MYCAM|nr:hypothetical protein QYF61_000094 [Mycteria americana]